MTFIRSPDRSGCACACYPVSSWPVCLHPHISVWSGRDDTKYSLNKTHTTPNYCSVSHSTIFYLFIYTIFLLFTFWHVTVEKSQVQIIKWMLLSSTTQSATIKCISAVITFNGGRLKGPSLLYMMMMIWLAKFFTLVGWQVSEILRHPICPQCHKAEKLILSLIPHKYIERV